MAGFKDKVIIVTGAAQGVGRAVALQLAHGGAKLVLADRLAENCAQTKADLGIGEGHVLTVGADLETEDGARQMVEETIAQFGRIDVAINNVGGAIKSKPFWEFSGAELKAEISRSLWPTLWCCREIVPVMIKQRAGSIVNIGSAATGWMWRVPYSAAKGGVHALTTCLAREVAEYDIRVNCVAPGALAISDRVVPRSATQPTEADLAWRQKAFDQSLADTPMARLGLPDEVAAAVCFLASDEASYITGQTLFVAGGETG